MAELAGRIGDGLIGTGPDKKLLGGLSASRAATGPRFGQVTLCWAASEPEARRTAHEWWPTAALHGEVTQELPNPAQFTDLVEERDRGPGRRGHPVRPDAEVHLAKIQEYIDAGYDHVYLHQVGPDQDGFLEFARKELLPRSRLGRPSRSESAATAGLRPSAARRGPRCRPRPGRRRLP